MFASSLCPIFILCFETDVNADHRLSLKAHCSDFAAHAATTTKVADHCHATLDRRVTSDQQGRLHL